MEPINLAAVSETFERRARAARRAAWLSVCLILATVFALILFFFVYSRSEDGFYLRRFEPWERRGAAEEKPETTETLKLRYEVELKRAEIAAAEQQRAGIIITLTSAVARVGAVVVGLYLVQILFGITRYHFRLADHLDTCAKSLTIVSGTPSLLGQVMAALSTSTIDFGKSPTTPIDKVLDVVKEALGRARVG